MLSNSRNINARFAAIQMLARLIAYDVNTFGEPITTALNKTDKDWLYSKSYMDPRILTEYLRKLGKMDFTYAPRQWTCYPYMYVVCLGAQQITLRKATYAKLFTIKLPLKYSYIDLPPATKMLWTRIDTYNTILNYLDTPETEIFLQTLAKFLHTKQEQN